MRSPYGIPRNLFNPALIPGGSSSGSAIAVAAGLVPLALGTDTAGSGRVPAGLGNIVGLKPSLGLVSTAGVVPACRTLDCVSVFALTVDDAFGRSPQWQAPMPPIPIHARVRSARSERCRKASGSACRCRGSACSSATRRRPRPTMRRSRASPRSAPTIVEIDIEPFYETARLLYEGPWVAERYITARKLIASAPESMHPVTRQIILAGARPSAVDAFAAFYELEELRRVRDHIFRRIDALALPTMPTAYTIEQVLADPIGLNSRLGTYTNFVNLLDLCALAVPAAMHEDGTPFGITLLALAGHDAALASIGRVFHADTGLPLGATNVAQPPLAPTVEASGRRRNRHRRRRRASLRHAAQRRAEILRRALPGEDRDRSGLSPVRARRHARRRSRGCCG